MENLKPFPKKPKIKGLLRVTSLPGRKQPKPVDLGSFQPTFVSESTAAGVHKRRPGRPRIHPVKVKIPGRGRGRPAKTPEQKAQVTKPFVVILNYLYNK